MDYILASLFALMVGAFAAHYHRLTARAQALSVVHTRLVQALNAHSTAIASSAQANPHLHFPVQNLLRKLRAIQTLGLPAVDQQMDVYDALWSIYHQNAPQEILEQHDHLQALKMEYNQMAFAYNDCQRSALQSRMASLFGHTMAPPC